MAQRGDLKKVELQHETAEGHPKTDSDYSNVGRFLSGLLEHWEQL
jgi:hypothetical protein